jgi:hypothetical protein
MENGKFRSSNIIYVTQRKSNVSLLCAEKNLKSEGSSD